MLKSVTVFDLQGFYKVKSVSLFRLTRFLQGQIRIPFRFAMLLPSKKSLPFSIYNGISGSNSSLSFDLQCFEGSLFLDLQGFYRAKSVSLSIFSVFTG